MTFAQDKDNWKKILIVYIHEKHLEIKCEDLSFSLQDLLLLYKDSEFVYNTYRIFLHLLFYYIYENIL